MAAYVKYVWSAGDLLSSPRFNNLETQYDKTLSMVANFLWPVNCIYITASSTHPTSLLGFGTWSAFATGLVLVGYDASQAEFNAAEKIGGESLVQIVEATMPAHTHVQDAHNHTQNSHNHTQVSHSHTITNKGSNVQAAAASPTTSVIDDSGSFTTSSVAATNNAQTAVNNVNTATNQNNGGNGYHNNLQPYIVVKMWKRTA